SLSTSHAPPAIYSLSLHDALPISDAGGGGRVAGQLQLPDATPWTESEQLAFEKETLGLYWSGHPVDRYAAALRDLGAKPIGDLRSEEHTSELQSRFDLVCRLLLEK